MSNRRLAAQENGEHNDMGFRDNIRMMTDRNAAETLAAHATGQYQRDTPGQGLTAAAAQLDTYTGGGTQPVVIDHDGRPLRRVQATAYDSPRAMVASAQKINLKNADDVMGLRNRVYCGDTLTEIFTKSGWKTYDTLQVGEEIWSLNKETLKAEWQAVTAVNVFDVIDEPMYHFESQVHSSLTTANHRWFGYEKNKKEISYKITTSEEITKPFIIPCSARAAEFPEQETYSDDYVELVSWIFTEGTFPTPRERKTVSWQFKSGAHKIAWKQFYDAEFERSKSRPPRFNGLRYGILTYDDDQANNGVLSITLQKKMAKKTQRTLEEIQSYFEQTPRINCRRIGEISQHKSVNPDHWEQIYKLLTNMFGPESAPFEVGAGASCAHLSDDRTGNPRWYSTPKYFRINEDILRVVEADLQGDVKCPTREFIYKLTEQQLELFIKTAVKADGSVTTQGAGFVFSQNRVDRIEIFELACYLLGYAANRSVFNFKKYGPQYFCKPRKLHTATLSPKNLTIENYTGKVWCPTVPNGMWFARRNGKTYHFSNTEWQNDVWSYNDAIGEVQYGFSLIGSCMSRIKLYPAINFAEEKVPLSISDYRLRMARTQIEGEPADTLPNQQIPETSGITPEVLDYAERLMRDLRSGSGGSSGMMRMFAINMCVAGECYLIQVEGRWYIKSTSELIVSQGGQIILRTQRAGSSTTTAGTVYGDVILPRNTPMYRLWREHPRYSHEPVSSMLALREICDEIVTLQRTIRTIARSRMNAGLLFIPDGLTVPGTSITADMAQNEEQWDDFIARLYDSITAPIIDEYNAATVVPAIITGPGEQGANIRYIQVNREIDQFVVERLDKALVRLLQGMDLPRDIVTGNQGIKYCVNAADHEILTKNGWKLPPALTLGEDVWTINPTTRKGEWQPLLAVNVFDVVDEEMHRYDLRSHSSLSTGGHRWFGRIPQTKRGGRMVPNFDDEFRTSDDINDRRFNIPVAARAADFPKVEKYTHDFVELVAWMMTEGFLPEKKPRKDGNGTLRRWGSIGQCDVVNAPKCDRIAAALEATYGPPTLPVGRGEAATVPGRRVGYPQWYYKPGAFMLNEEILESFDDVLQGGVKCPPREFVYALTRTQLQLFVDVCILGDGCSSGGRRVFGQNRLDRQEVFELACHLLGIPINRRSNGTPRKGETFPWWDVALKERSEVSLYRRKAQKIIFTGKVWCPTTTNGTWFCRNNGHFFFTANSNAIVANDSLVVGHLEPLALMMCDGITSAYFRPLLKKKFRYLSDDDLDRLTIWYDPTELTLPPDSSASATIGLENNVLSADAWRRSNGFSDADAPGEQELIRNLLFKLAVLQPDQMEMMMQRAFPQTMDAARAANAMNAPVPMPTSAMNLLYGTNGGQNGVNPDADNPGGDTASGGDEPNEEPGAPTGRERGANGDAPGGATTYTNQNNQENRSTKVRDQSLDGGNGYTRGIGTTSGINYGYR